MNTAETTASVILLRVFFRYQLIFQQEKSDIVFLLPQQNKIDKMESPIPSEREETKCLYSIRF